MWIRSFPKFYFQKKEPDEDPKDLIPIYGNICFLCEVCLQDIISFYSHFSIYKGAIVKLMFLYKVL